MLSQRWQKIQASVNKFCGCLATIISRNQSGTNEQDKVKFYMCVCVCVKIFFILNLNLLLIFRLQKQKKFTNIYMDQDSPWTMLGSC